jgi:hypothetical protein
MTTTTRKVLIGLLALALLAALGASSAAFADPGPRLKCPHHGYAAADGSFDIQCEVSNNGATVTIFVSVEPCVPGTFASLAVDHSQVQPVRGTPDGFHVEGRLQPDANGNYTAACFTVIIKDAEGNELDRANVSVRVR